MYAYCGNNPVSRADVVGFVWDTVIDVVSLGFSIADTIQNPNDPTSWLGVAADVASLVVPFLSGGGAAVKAATKADDVVAAVKAADRIEDTASAAKTGWKVGDDITNLTKAGNTPSWSTVRQRYWKNEAYFNPTKYTDNNLNLMKKGRAPLVEAKGTLYPMELHHKIPRYKGGSNSYSNLIPLTPWEHGQMDPFRYFK